MKREHTRRSKVIAVGSAAALALSVATMASVVLADEHDTPAQANVVLTQVAASDVPTAGTAGPDGTVWIAERAGLVRPLGEQGLGEPVLDITAETTTDGERGLLGIAFDNSFEHFYISYTDLNGTSTIDEFAMADGVPQLGSRRTLLTQDQPFSNHNGGDIAVGPDGMLYIALGDGGSSGDPLDNGQDLGTFLGKMLRIDPSGGDPYGIPADNPFVGDPQARDEIWAFGLRNPWRFSFDAQTGDLWIADVGQNLREEVNRAAAGTGGGENYGWARMEGTLPFSGEEPDDHVPPVFEYGNDGARCSVAGGYVYRGSAIPQLHGAYLFSDYCDGTIRGLELSNGQVVGDFDLGVDAGNVVSFVEGPDLELYVLSLRLFANAVFRIDPADQPTESPTASPTASPTESPTPSPTASPTASPTESPTPTDPEGGCLVQYSANDWGGHPGFTATVNITNTSGSTIDGWSLEWQFSAGQVVNEHWSSSITQTGPAVTAVNADWSSTIAPSQTVSFGFNGAATAVGNNPPPTAFTLNGTSCTVS